MLCILRVPEAQGTSRVGGSERLLKLKLVSQKQRLKVCNKIFATKENTEKTKREIS